MSRPEDRTQEVWDALSALRTFKVDDLAGRPKGASRIGLTRLLVQDYVSGWLHGGHLRRVGTDAQWHPIYERVTESAEAPSLPKRRSGQLSEAQAQAIWTAARLMKVFDTVDLSACASTGDVYVTQDDARMFCRMLLTAGYLRVVQMARPNVRAARYKLLRDTGPLAPLEKRVRAVIDPNLADYVYLPELAS
jgi:hypothetical protein